MDATIRPATEADDDALRRIDRATWSTDTTPGPVPDVDASFFEPGRPPTDTIVAEVDGAVVGYVLVGSGFPMPSHAHVAFLHGLAVDPSAQGRGIARRLVEAALAECARRGARRIRSKVLSTNAASLALHRAVGFVVEGTFRGEFVIAGNEVDDVQLAFCFDSPPPPEPPR